MSKWSDLGVRSASALILAPLVVEEVWLGGVWFTAFVATLGVLMAWEWVAIAHAHDAKQFSLHAFAVCCAALLVPYASVLILILALLSIVIAAQAGTSRLKWKILGIPYVAFPILALALLRRDPEWGVYALVWCISIVWAADILAYFAGRIIGGPKLAPKLSPKKTWAGLGGAVAGAISASLAVSYGLGLSYFPLALIAAVLAVLEQGGDIFESAFKRAHNVKDSSDLIPGHGGILDRIDGLIAVIIAASLIGYLHNNVSAAAGLLLW
jgi:phosphatidate cytidylyltransferase